MNIQISTEALKGSTDSLLWSGALYGLKRIQQLGHAIRFDGTQLTDYQQVLLDNEQITSDSFDAESADLEISAGQQHLTATDKKETQMEAQDWITLSQQICFPVRKASGSRSTAETDISIALNLDGTGQSNIDTGIRFLDHMLDQISKHGLIDLDLQCNGDLEVDEHHTIEDTAIVLGKTILEALGSKIGITRYSFVLPMDESQSQVALDFSGRPYLVFDGGLEREYVGDMPTDMVEHFFYSLAINMRAMLHISVKGKNDHHKIESCFKGLARCLRASVSRSERNLNILPSTKDKL